MKRKSKNPDFDLPGSSKITGRKSTITGLFLTSITPCIVPTDADIHEALNVLGMSSGACVCAYCGDRRTEWDHFRAIVKDRKPTGYITEIANLVPSCGKCNQSKGNKPWLEWIRSEVPRSPTKRKIADLEGRIERLNAYEKWREPCFLDFEALLGEEHWKSHMSHLNSVLDLLTLAEKHAEICRQLLAEARPSSPVG